MNEIILKYILIFLAVIILYTILIFIIRFILIKKSNIVSKDFLNDKNIKQMKNLFKVHKETIKFRGEGYSVEGFSLETNTFTFKNIGTNTSLDGNCMGFALLTKQIFSDRLVRVYEDKGSKVYDLSFIDKNLSKYELDDETAFDVYSDNDDSEIDSSDIQNIQKAAFLYNKEKIKLYSPEFIYKRIFAHPDVFTEYSESNRNSQVIQILKAIEFYQSQFESNQKIFKITSSLPFVYKEEAEAVYFKVSSILLRLINKHKLISISKLINKILDCIDDDQLVVIGIFNPYFEGHAVLAYKYEEIDDNTIKVYVYDSNLPLLKETDRDCAQINNDIKNNGYILFKRIGREWIFIYSPEVNGNFLYHGIMNSYVPDTRITILEPPKYFVSNANLN